MRQQVRGATAGSDDRENGTVPILYRILNVLFNICMSKLTNKHNDADKKPSKKICLSRFFKNIPIRIPSVIDNNELEILITV